MISEQARSAVDTFQKSQNELCDYFSNIDGQAFRKDIWERRQGGGGITAVLESDQVFEKAGINTSAVHGKITGDEIALFTKIFQEKGVQMAIENTAFFATGISLVLHPHNPFVPTFHANCRYFECSDGKNTIWWFGGGMDLTPYYLFEYDAIEFHQKIQEKCNNHNKLYYPQFKAACDRYFYLPHRKETRGVGGIFFDYMNNHYNQDLQFIKTITDSLSDIYGSIVKRRLSTPYDTSHRDWQLYRRGRYVEFNLIYDKGTLFGLKTNGRTESILMSLPKVAHWGYQDPEISQDSEESKLIQVLKTPRNWV